MQPNGFQIKIIQFKKLDFEWIEELREGIEIDCVSNTGAVAKKSAQNEYTIQLNAKLSFKQEDAEIFYIQLVMVGTVEVGSAFKETLLNNAVVIMQFYLQPVVDQMITTAKLPQLDLPFIDFGEFEVKVEK
ncbi:protein-export chaperone SecB [Helicobacter mesocricetorum]|uniref:protein-export chaperone SecB n=1 Tax=Helicobacter mesocricetorum TaxID=87012 RepID=UPI000CF1BF9B|nr:protein-export chaperone SecB [Helicobacter mesocricetorum]